MQHSHANGIDAVDDGGVLANAILMLGSARYSAAMIVKIALGLLAIVANLFCVVLLFRRATAAESGDSSRFRRYDRLHYQVGAVVLVAIFAALALGVIGG
jgi:uncharacterized membrane protein YkvI